VIADCNCSCEIGLRSLRDFFCARPKYATPKNLNLAEPFGSCEPIGRRNQMNPIAVSTAEGRQR
jgi:hypothetical protein